MNSWYHVSVSMYSYVFEFLCLYKLIYSICYPIERLLEFIHKAQKVVAETQLELRAQLSTPKR